MNEKLNAEERLTLTEFNIMHKVIEKIEISRHRKSTEQLFNVKEVLHIFKQVLKI